MGQASLETSSHHVLLTKPGRLLSVDVARGVIVALSVLLINMPYAFAKHAEWYGMTLADLVFPAFSTIFGVGLGIAHFKQIRWARLLRRTVLFIFAGLLYNVMMAWSLDFSTLRLTGVLQLYAINGFLAALAISLNKNWKFPLFLAVFIMTTYAFSLYWAGKACPQGLIQPDCNLFLMLDTLVFGEAHLYAQGNLGHDPEGIAVIYSALANVFLGAATGRVLVDSKIKNKSGLLTMVGIVLLGACYLFSQFTPVAKKIWTPAFVALTSGIVILFIALLYKLLDEREVSRPKSWLTRAVLYLLTGYGLNSLLVYFGVYFVVMALAQNRILGSDSTEPLRDQLISLVAFLPGHEQLNYALIFFVLWTLLVAVLHRLKWYVRI